LVLVETRHVCFVCLWVWRRWKLISAIGVWLPKTQALACRLGLNICPKRLSLTNNH
jgi:hypothetical protein